MQCGWIIAFVSSVIADVNEDFPNFAWWSLVYMLGVIIGVFVGVSTNSIQTYNVAIVGFLSAGLVFTTSSVNSLIYWSDGAKEAGAAGFILLSMVCIVWIFYYGSTPQATHRQTIDSFALHKEHAPSRRTSRPMTQSYPRPETTHSASQPQQMYNSSALAGFETSSPVAGYPAGQTKQESASAFPAPLQPQQQQQPLAQQSHPLPPVGGMGMHSHHDSAATQAPAEYPYRAKAIYTYEANPDDANEISFTKHEILEVSDVSGRWWQAKKETGETGIAPSNYLILL